MGPHPRFFSLAPQKCAVSVFGMPLHGFVSCACRSAIRRRGVATLGLIYLRITLQICSSVAAVSPYWRKSNINSIPSDGTSPVEAIPRVARAHEMSAHEPTPDDRS